MQLSINPTITGGFVIHTMRDAKVAKHIETLNLTDEEAHNFIKAVLIAGTRDLKVDFNKSTGIRIDQVLERLDKEDSESG